MANDKKFIVKSGIITPNVEFANGAGIVSGNTTFSNSVTVTGNTFFRGGVVANSSLGANGLVLTSNGSSVYWGSVSASSGGDIVANTVTIGISNVSGTTPIKTFSIVTNNQSANNTTYEIGRISRDSVNWSTQSLEVTIYNIYYRGGMSRWGISFNQVDSGTVELIDRSGTFPHKLYLGAEVIVSGTIGYRPILVDLPQYTIANIEMKYKYNEVTTINGSSQLQFTGTYTTNASATGYASASTSQIANNSLYLGGFLPAYYTNATNITTGTLPEAQLPFRMNQNVRTTDNVTFANLTITGSVIVTGNVTTWSSNNLNITDNMIYLNANSQVANPDLGFAANYNDGTYRHTGFFRDATDGVWKVFDQYLPEPDASPYINTANLSFRIADFQANVVNASAVVINNNQAYRQKDDAGTVRYLLNTGSDGSVILYGYHGTSMVQGVNGATYLYGSGAGSTVMTLTTGGNAGIGNTTPGQRLQVDGSVGIKNGLVANGAFGTNGHVLTSNGTAIYWAAANANISSISSANNSTYLVGRTWATPFAIGSTVANSGAFTSLSATGDFNITSAYPRIYLVDTNNNSDFSIINNDGSFSIYDDTNTTHRFSITPSGNVAIGSTSAPTRLFVNGHMSVANGFGIYANGVLGANGLVLTSNGSSLFWGSVSSGTATTANNATYLQGRIWETAGAIGSTVANTGAFTRASTTNGLADNTGTNNILRLVNPGGASYGNTTSTVNGAIKIKLPVAANNSSTMMRMTVKFYDYNGGSSGTSRSIDLGGYNYIDGGWYNIFATQTTMGGADVNVRFGYDGTGNCIWIGETNSTWAYPNIFVTDFQGGHSNFTHAIWGSGWTISAVTAFDTVTGGPIIAAKQLTSQNFNSYALGISGTAATANNASFLNGRIWETAGAIGSTVANTGAFTTLIARPNQTGAIAAVQASNNTIGIYMVPNAGSGSYNNLVSAGDNLIYFSNNTINGGNLVIGAWSDRASGYGIRFSNAFSIAVASNTFTMNANTTINGNTFFNRAIFANGAIGANGLVLTSNGNGVFWGSVSAGGTTTNAVTFNNGGSGDASGTTFNGSAARTISYNTVGAPSTTGTNASGSWGISVTGSAATLTTARNIGDVSFNGSAAIVPERISFKDTRSTNYNPATYPGVSVHLKTNGTDGLSDGGTYHGVLDVMQWSDLSGGNDHQLAFTDNNNMWLRQSTNSTAWGAWAQIITTTSGIASSATTTNAVTFNNGGSGNASGTTFNGSAARTISYNTVGAPSTTGTNASGNWGINITGSAATATAPTFSGDSATKDNITTRTETGFYETSTGTLAEGWPTDSGGYHHLISSTHSNDANYYALQISSRFDTQNLYFRNTNSSGTTAWSTLLHSGNYNSYAPTLTGTGASGTWGISVTGNAGTASVATQTVTGTNGADLVYGNMGDNDQFRIRIGATATNAGYVEIATADDGTEPIYVRQYSGTFTTLTRTATLLDGSGNTSFPGDITAVQNLNSTNGRLYLNNATNNFIIAQGGASSALYMEARGGGFNVRDAGSGSSWFTALNGTCTATTDFRAPIFYDSNNTAYYMNPLGTTNLLGNLYVARDGTSNDVFGGLEVREYSYAGAATGAANEAPGVNFHWSNRGAARIYMNGSGNFVFAGQSDITNNRRDIIFASGYATTRVDAPIFRDSDNTAFYFDGASTTNINTMSGNGKTMFETSDTYLRINQSASFSAGIWTGSSNFLNSGGVLGWGSNGGTTNSRVYIAGGTYNGTNVISLDGSNGRITALDIRSQIFYDTDNTGFYVNPAGDTNLNKTFTYLGGKDINANWNTGFSNTPTQSYNFHGDISSGGPAGTWWFYESMRHSNAAALWGTQIAWGWEDNANRLQQRNITNGTFQSWVEYLNTSGRTYSGGLTMTGSIISTASDVRAPIFYDQNDTSYYGNFAGTSYINALNIGPTASGSSYLNINGYNAYGGTGYHGFLTVYNTYSSATTPQQYWRLNGAGGWEIVNSPYNAVLFTFTQGGDFTAAGNVTAYSDRKLKDNFEPISDAVNKVLQLNGVTFTRIDKDDTTQRYAGLIAQDVEPVLPEAVQKNDTMSYGEVLSVDYNATIALLVEAIKEQQAHINRLEQQINLKRG